VPAGQRLHIEFVSLASPVLSTNGAALIYAGLATISTTVNGAAVTHTVAGSGVALTTLASLYADARSPVTISAAVNSVAVATVSGELIGP